MEICLRYTQMKLLALYSKNTGTYICVRAELSKQFIYYLKTLLIILLDNHK